MPVLNAEKPQAPPFCVQVELVEGCNLRCGFCGLNGIRGKENNYKFMTLELATHLSRAIRDTEGWNPRIEFAMHGEPSMNPNMIPALATFRENLPRAHLMMTTNGAGFLKDPTRIDAALQYLNVLAMDWYEGVAIVPKLLESYKGSIVPKRYPQNMDANPHRRRGYNEHDWVVIQDIAVATKGTHASLNNHAGAGAPKNDSAAGKRCAKPFRELSIRWDGNVAVCCNDWRGEYKCGNVWDQTLDELWHNRAFVAARRKLYRGERDFGPCAGCDALSYRPGLLPDQRGKETMMAPTQADEKVIENALAGNPYTLPVLRLWEIAEEMSASAIKNPAG